MAFDGIVVAALADEFDKALTGGKIAKIAQPEADELLLTVKNRGETYRLLISASASLPFFYLTEQNKPSPVTAPTFCMMLRKHIANGRIISVSQMGLERILILEIEHLNEMGDLCRKKLITEIMGKHSNIIFCDENNMILDSIKHISANISSLREVLPGRSWFLPAELQKENPLQTDEAAFSETVLSKPQPLFKAIYTSYAGISPLTAQEVIYRSGLDAATPANALTPVEGVHLAHQFMLLMDEVRQRDFHVNIVYEQDAPKDFSAIDLTLFSPEQARHFSSISAVVEQFYAEKSLSTRMKAKSADLRKIVHTLLERNVKKLDLQERQLKDTEKRESYRLYGELLTAYGYSLPAGLKETTVHNYYDDTDITIPLDPDFSPIENAKRYYNKYAKAKRMYEATMVQIAQTREEIAHLDSIDMELSLALDENDLKVIKSEMQQFGFIKKHAPGGKKGEKQPKMGKPYHYVTEEGFHIYVGRNNYQNEELTFEFADGGDYWFHAKGIPGSHVIVKTGGKELPDHIYELAGSLAAYYSKGRDNDKVEVDYIQRKFVKKTPGGKPGFVIYHTNYSLVAKPDISGVKLV
jgi:predicted ribosome quality control (RQC) complex YloA/Tae2 family protein